MFDTFCNWLRLLTRPSKRPTVGRPGGPAAPAVEALEDRLALSTAAVLGAPPAGGGTASDFSWRASAVAEVPMDQHLPAGQVRLAAAGRAVTLGHDAGLAVA